MNYARITARWPPSDTRALPLDTGIAHVVASQNEALVFTACRARLPVTLCTIERDRSSVPVCWVCEGKGPKGT